MSDETNPDSVITEITYRQLDCVLLEAEIETLLFISDKPLSPTRIKNCLQLAPDDPVFNEALQRLMDRTAEARSGLELVTINDGLQLRTKLENAHVGQALIKILPQKLSGGALETLAIIAYQQPVLKDDVDQIRGVDSSYFIRTLLDRKLIHMISRSELPGRPLLYGTTAEFLEVFGLANLSALPSLAELSDLVPHSEVGGAADEPPHVRQLRRFVGEMRMEKNSALYFDAAADERILQEFREEIARTPTSTPYLDSMDQPPPSPSPEAAPQD